MILWFPRFHVKSVTCYHKPFSSCMESCLLGTVNHNFIADMLAMCVGYLYNCLSSVA